MPTAPFYRLDGTPQLFRLEIMRQLNLIGHVEADLYSFSCSYVFSNTPSVGLRLRWPRNATGNRESEIWPRIRDTDITKSEPF